jgi:hypothetical protein
LGIVLFDWYNIPFEADGRRGQDSSCAHEISSKRNAKVEKPKASFAAPENRTVQRNFPALLVGPLGLGRGRRRLHVFWRFLALEAVESSDTLRSILPSETNITRSSVEHRTATMDAHCIYAVPITKPLPGNFGIYHGRQEIREALSRYG